MPATVTVTGTIGAGTAVTAAVLLNVSVFTIDTTDNTLEVTISGVVTIYSIAAATTITATKSGSTYTLAIS